MKKNQGISSTFVKLIYLIPRNKHYNPKYKEATVWALKNVNEWFKSKLSGLSFQIFIETPITVILNHDSRYFITENQDIDPNDKYSHERSIEICSKIFNSQHNDEKYTTVCYLDGGLFGRGYNGFCFLPKEDLEGISSEYTDNKPGRWVGGLAHELGHALDLHEYKTEFDKDDYLMGSGFYNYPNTKLTRGNIERLKHSIISQVDGIPEPNIPIEWKK